MLKLCERADILIEGMRPGVMEHLGLGPDACTRKNAALVYGRVTGWGQTGPLAHAAGHDLNYIGLTGALHAIGRAGQPPTPPLNLVGDFGGGALYLALGVVAALLEARRSGRGQVVDAAMIDGAASLMTAAYALRSAGLSTDTRGDNVLDGGAHFYDVYETRDGRHIALAAIEPKFYAVVIERLGLDPDALPHSQRREEWPALKAKLAAVIRTRTRDECVALLEGTDACFAPVLDMDEGAPPSSQSDATDLRRTGRTLAAKRGAPLQSNAERGPTGPGGDRHGGAGASTGVGARRPGDQSGAHPPRPDGLAMRCVRSLESVFFGLTLHCQELGTT